VSPIYKPIAYWIANFHSICLALKEYIDQQDEVDSHLTSQLAKLNDKYSDNVDLNYQKLSNPFSK
jgi:hypothetical protein